MLGSTAEQTDTAGSARQSIFYSVGNECDPIGSSDTAQYLKVDVRDLKLVFTRAHPRLKRRQAKKGKVAVK